MAWAALVYPTVLELLLVIHFSSNLLLKAFHPDTEEFVLSMKAKSYDV